MLEDVTIDTNVFLHSANEAEMRCEHSKQLLFAILAGKTSLCIDEGFDLIESKNRSAIGSEYYKHLRFVDAAFAIIVALGKQGRILQVKRAISHSNGKLVRQLVAKQSDRSFVGVAYNSKSKVFVSHDFEDFSIPKRAKIKKSLAVNIVEAEEACTL